MSINLFLSGSVEEKWFHSVFFLVGWDESYEPKKFFSLSEVAIFFNGYI